MRSLTLKLTLAFVLVCVLEAVLVGTLARQATQREFGRFCEKRAAENLAEEVLAHYQEHGTWEGVREAMRPGVRRQRERLSRPEHRRDSGPRAPEPGERPARSARRGLPPGAPPPPFTLVDQARRVLLPSGQYRVGDEVEEAALVEGIPIVSNGEVVGTVIRRRAVGNWGQGKSAISLASTSHYSSLLVGRCWWRCCSASFSLGPTPAHCASLLRPAALWPRAI